MKKIVCLTVFLLLIFISACDNGLKESESADVMTNATDGRYDKMEIREYKGTRLDPSVGPRDNSIKRNPECRHRGLYSCSDGPCKARGFYAL